jgi:hypothetical protein
VFPRRLTLDIFGVYHAVSSPSRRRKIGPPPTKRKLEHDRGDRANPERPGYNGAMPAKKWSQGVTEHSNALDLEESVFTLDDPKEIAQSLKRSAEHSKRRKTSPYRSAMSMLTFYINRAGKNLPKKQLRILEQAKDELRALRWE